MENRRAVVIIDDDVDDIEVFVDVLKGIFPTYSCIPFTDACKALEFLKTCDIIPRIIIIDYKLPDMSVEQCIKEITSLDSMKDTKIAIHSSALPRRKVMDDFQSEGISFFQKPSSMLEFETMIRRLLEPL